MSRHFSDKPLDLSGKKIWVAGHNGMVGSALCRQLESEDCHILTVSKAECDLRVQKAVDIWLENNKPDIIIVAAAKVGGIGANAAYPADFLYDNLMVAANVIHAAYKIGVEKLLFLGSSCIYPKRAEQPIKEDALLSAPLEPTNEAYAIAKIAGLKLCEMYRRQYGANFISAMPCNLYGVGDHYHPENAHVIPAMIMKFHQAKIENKSFLELWGTGTPLREFLYSDDLAKGLIYLLKHYEGVQHINVGSGQEISIKDLAMKVADAVGYKGDIRFDSTKPDGTPRKIMDNSNISESEWRPETSLEDGIRRSYEDYLDRVFVKNAA